MSSCCQNPDRYDNVIKGLIFLDGNKETFWLDIQVTYCRECGSIFKIEER